MERLHTLKTLLWVLTIKQKRFALPNIFDNYTGRESLKAKSCRAAPET